jgi:hypothetical protein
MNVNLSDDPSDDLMVNLRRRRIFDGPRAARSG